MFTAQTRVLHSHRQRFVAATAKLDAMSPLKVLTRGYAMVQNGEHTVVRSVKQTFSGDQLSISLSDGILTATVTDSKENAL